MANLFQHPGPESRWTLKNEDPLVAEGFEEPRKSIVESSLRLREDETGVRQQTGFEIACSLK